MDTVPGSLIQRLDKTFQRERMVDVVCESPVPSPACVMDSWVWTILFLAVAVCFAFAEIFVPSGGALAFMAVATLLVSVVFAFFSGPLFGTAYFAAVTVGVPVFLWYAFNWWPNTVIGRRILLNPEEDPALQPNVELERLKTLIGKRGIARSQMMLSGLIEVEGRRLNALSESVIIEQGSEIVVVSADGINVIVRPVTKKTVASDTVSPEVEPTVEDPFV